MRNNPPRRQLLLATLAAAVATLMSPLVLPASRPARVTLFHWGEVGEGDDSGLYRTLLAKEGFVEPRNLSIEVVTARSGPEVGPLVRSVVERRPDLVILSWRFGPVAKAFQAATRDIPIVFTGSNDPVGAGLVKSLRRPGGNLTGSSSPFQELMRKRLELFAALGSRSQRLAVLASGLEQKDDPSWTAFVADARKLGVAIVFVERAADRSLHDLVNGLRQSKAGAFLPLIPGSVSFWAGLQERSGLPGLFASPEVARGGGFLGLGANDEDTARRAVAVAARILRGESPAVIPVDQSIVFDLAVNLRTARALGIAVPQSILVQATAVFD